MGMSLARQFPGGVFCHAVANLIVDSFARGGPAVDERNVKQDVVEVRLGNGCPNHASHLVDDSFLCQSLAESAKHCLFGMPDIPEEPGLGRLPDEFEL